RGPPGGPRQRTDELGATATRHADPELLDLEPILLAGHGETDAADGLTAQIRLIDRQGDARAPVGRQQLPGLERQWDQAFARPCALGRPGNAIEVEPARGELHIALESVLPACRGLADHQLGP